VLDEITGTGVLDRNCIEMLDVKKTSAMLDQIDEIAESYTYSTYRCCHYFSLKL
jgi:hypothetical protein